MAREKQLPQRVGFRPLTTLTWENGVRTSQPARAQGTHSTSMAALYSNLTVDVCAPPNLGSLKAPISRAWNIPEEQFVTGRGPSDSTHTLPPTGHPVSRGAVCLMHVSAAPLLCGERPLPHPSYHGPRPTLSCVTLTEKSGMRVIASKTHTPTGPCSLSESR